MRTRSMRGAHGTCGTERGSALLMTLVMMVGLAAMGASLLAMGSSQGKERRAWQDRVTAELGARAGIAEAWTRLESGEDPGLGTSQQREPLGYGRLTDSWFSH